MDTTAKNVSKHKKIRIYRMWGHLHTPFDPNSIIEVSTGPRGLKHSFRWQTGIQLKDERKWMNPENAILYME